MDKNIKCLNVLENLTQIFLGYISENVSKTEF